MTTALGALLTDAADGRFLASDGGWRRVPPWRDGVEAVVAFTGHAVLAVADDVDDAALAALDPNGFGGAHDPRTVAALAGTGWIDALDAVLVTRGRGGPSSLLERDDLDGHPRVAHARRLRDDVRVLTDAEGLGFVILAAGLGGLTEVSIEVEQPGRRHGRALIESALAEVPGGEVVCAGVAPGNAASLRAFLAVGFVPVASAQLYVPERHPTLIKDFMPTRA